MNPSEKEIELIDHALEYFRQLVDNDELDLRRFSNIITTIAMNAAVMMPEPRDAISNLVGGLMEIEERPWLEQFKP